MVPHPDMAAPIHGATEVLEALVSAYAVVAIVTGRRTEDVTSRLPVDGLTYMGVYGMEAVALDLLAPIEPEVERSVLSVPEAWIERKGASLAVHFRAAPDPVAARAALLMPLQGIATDHGLRLVEGKAVLELLPADLPMKGGAVERMIGEHDLAAALFAGDDVADLEAFHALDALQDRDGLLALRVAVRSPETPEPLLDAADEIVDGPLGLVELLGQLT